MADAAPLARRGSQPPFSIEDVRTFVSRNAATVREGGHDDLARSLEMIDVDVLYADLEKLEQELTGIEEAVILRLRAAASEEMLFRGARHAGPRTEAVPRQDDCGTTRDAGKAISRMQTARIDRLPRLSLFYL